MNLLYVKRYCFDMVEFNLYYNIIHEYLDADVVSIIKYYFNNMNNIEFTDEFIKECKKPKSYLFKDKYGESLINYLIKKNKKKVIKTLLCNNLYVYIKYFNNNELYNLCENCMTEVLMNIKGLEIEHFLNKNNMGDTILHLLCKNSMTDAIMNIKGLKIEHFQNINKNGNTELMYLCINKLTSVIMAIANNSCLKAKHFIHISHDKTYTRYENNTYYMLKNVHELFVLCRNKMYNIINMIDGLNITHFMIDCGYEKNALSRLFGDNQYDIIKNIDGITAYHFDIYKIYAMIRLGIFPKISDKLHFESKQLIDRESRGKYKPDSIIYELCKNNNIECLNKIINFKIDHFKVPHRHHKYERSEYHKVLFYTALYWVFRNKNINLIPNIQGLTIDKIDALEFRELCKNKMGETIMKIKGLTIEYIITRTEIFDMLQEYNMQNIINNICERDMENSFECSDYFINKKSHLFLIFKYNIINVINKIKILNADHFMVKDIDGNTVMYYLCYHNLFDVIGRLKGLKIEHFQNVVKGGDTELHALCKLRRHDIIIYLVNKLNLEAKHFQNKNKAGVTELHHLCRYNMYGTIKYLVKKLKLEAKHFQNKDVTGTTELQNFCFTRGGDYHNKDNNIFIYLLNNLNLEAKHFLNIDRLKYTELHYLCQSGIADQIKCNIISRIKNLEASHFQSIMRPGCTELRYLCGRKDLNTIKYLLDNLNLEAKHFLNKDRNKVTELGELCDANIADKVKCDIFSRIKNLEASHFQSIMRFGCTNLHYLCRQNDWNTIKYLLNNLNLEAKHFLNEDRNGDTELGCLCKLYISDHVKCDIFSQIKNLEASHFQSNMHFGYTNLHYLCRRNNWNTIKYLLDNLNLEAKHFLNKNRNGNTELEYLCGLNTSDQVKYDIFSQIKNLKASHFQNNDISYNHLYQLYERDNQKTIKYLIEELNLKKKPYQNDSPYYCMGITNTKK